MSKTLRPMLTGEWSVSAASTDFVPQALTCRCFTAADVKMDWCNTDINGTQLDPKVQYPQMVRKHATLSEGVACCPTLLPAPPPVQGP